MMRISIGAPTIGVLAGWQFYRTATNLSYLTPIYRGIRRAAQDLGCNLLLGCGMGPSASPNDPLRPAWPFISPEHDFIPIGLQNTNGLIIAAPLHSPTRSAHVQELLAAGHPILFIGSGEAGPAIVADNTYGIHEALRHLADHGHQQIAFIAGSMEDMAGDTGDRLRAYHAGCEQYGLFKDARLVVYGRHVFDGGYRAMQQIMASGVKFTAVLASNDESALGAMKALGEAGRRIPQDVAIIGFDNRLEGAAHQPGLSSLHVPLFQMGYQAVERLLQHIEGQTPLSGTIKIGVRLVARESCGCGVRPVFLRTAESTPVALLPSGDQRRERLIQTITAALVNQAQSLSAEVCLAACERLVDTFTASLQSGVSSEFQKGLAEALQRTAANEDDLHIWQEAISLLGQEYQQWAAAEYSGESSASSAALANEILSEARLAISVQMHRQHRQHVIDDRWTSSRLSLLTAQLLTALDETQIYEALARHLPDMDIHTAMLALFEPEGDDLAAWSILQNVLTPGQSPVRFSTREFPPAGIFDKNVLYALTLIPIVDPSRQLGFMVFDAEHFDLYGSIVQQLGGALNTASLYHQAIEGRRMAEEANRMKSRFLSTISHELRTPLNLIVGLSSILLDESDEGKTVLPNPVHRDVERIQAYARHLGGLIGDVLDLATSGAGQLRLSMELIDLSETLRMVVESGSQLTADKGLKWRASLPETSTWVLGDRTRLWQVVLNLVNNAIKFTARGEIFLNLEADEHTATVSVQDTGIGIALEEQAAIFEEFHRSERSIAWGFPGLGLGLAICKTLVEMHSGTIGVHSTGIEGEGATFYFTLPVVQPPADQARQSITKPSDQPSVLVLLNRAGTGERLCKFLEQRGYLVQTALMDHIADWQPRLAKTPPDAIVLDVSVQSDLGWSTLKAIKSSLLARGIPTMFYTSLSEGDAVMNLDYLTKPIELAELTQALDQYWLVADLDHPVRTFLVVDDEPNTLEMEARIVQSHSPSNRVLKAGNGREALAILLQEPVDLVLLDLQMPEMDGFGVIDAMRASDSTRNIPVIVITGKELTEADMERLNQGVAVVLKKGLFSMDETVAHIRAALERKRRLSMDAQRLVRQAMAYIHEHYADQITRPDIAQHISIAEDYLTFCFRQELGITPIKYLQRYRVNQAKLLLKTSQKSITEIALETGFSDSGYFSRIFHRETGLSPEAFRSA